MARDVMTLFGQRLSHSSLCFANYWHWPCKNLQRLARWLLFHDEVSYQSGYSHAALSTVYYVGFRALTSPPISNALGQFASVQVSLVLT